MKFLRNKIKTACGFLTSDGKFHETLPLAEYYELRQEASKEIDKKFEKPYYNGYQYGLYFSSAMSHLETLGYKLVKEE